MTPKDEIYIARFGQDYGCEHCGHKRYKRYGRMISIRTIDCQQDELDIKNLIALCVPCIDMIGDDNLTIADLKMLHYHKLHATTGAMGKKLR